MMPLSENTFGSRYNSLFSHIHPLADKYKWKCAIRIQAGPGPAGAPRQKNQPQNSRYSTNSRIIPQQVIEKTVSTSGGRRIPAKQVVHLKSLRRFFQLWETL
jgi:hypothetical protein